MLLAPVATLALSFIDRKGKEQLPFICFVVAFVGAFLFVVCLPQGASMAFGAILYLLLSLIASGAAFLDK